MFMIKSVRCYSSVYLLLYIQSAINTAMSIFIAECIKYHLFGAICSCLEASFHSDKIYVQCSSQQMPFVERTSLQ